MMSAKRRPYVLVVVTGLFSPLREEEFSATVTRIYESDGMGSFDTVDMAINDLRGGLNRSEGVDDPDSANLISIDSIKIKPTSDEPHAYWNVYRSDRSGDEMSNEWESQG